MPSRPEDYEVLVTIGAGSYGRCQKVRRKADGKVSGVEGYSGPPRDFSAAAGASWEAVALRGPEIDSCVVG